jgi:hypothetical protein
MAIKHKIVADISDVNAFLECSTCGERADVIRSIERTSAICRTCGNPKSLDIPEAEINLLNALASIKSRSAESKVSVKAFFEFDVSSLK